MISPVQAVSLCQKIYDPKVRDFETVIQVKDIFFGVNYLEGSTVLTFRGTDNAEDVLADLKAWPEYDPKLGFVDAGFRDGLSEVLAKVQPLAKGPLVIAGHSLGAARGCMLAGLTQVSQLVLFGCPRVGWDKLKNAVEANGTRIDSFRNGEDPVTQEPFWMKHIKDPTQLYPNPKPALDVEAHMIKNYALSISQLRNYTG